jgi:hypothetical protein
LLFDRIASIFDIAVVEPGQQGEHGRTLGLENVEYFMFGQYE